MTRIIQLVVWHGALLGLDEKGQVWRAVDRTQPTPEAIRGRLSWYLLESLPTEPETEPTRAAEARPNPASTAHVPRGWPQWPQP